MVSFFPSARMMPCSFWQEREIVGEQPVHVGQQEVLVVGGRQDHGRQEHVEAQGARPPTLALWVQPLLEGVLDARAAHQGQRPLELGPGDHGFLPAVVAASPIAASAAAMAAGSASGQ
jgi:hypothetical protein